VALHRAAGMLREHVVEWLVPHGADVNGKAKGDWTPLDFAASGRLWDEDGTPARFASTAKVLVRAGAEMTSISAVDLGGAD
jgi:ankyrin repeat protein